MRLTCPRGASHHPESSQPSRASAPLRDGSEESDGVLILQRRTPGNPGATSRGSEDRDGAKRIHQPRRQGVDPLRGTTDGHQARSAPGSARRAPDCFSPGSGSGSRHFADDDRWTRRASLDDACLSFVDKSRVREAPPSEAKRRVRGGAPIGAATRRNPHARALPRFLESRYSAHQTIVRLTARSPPITPSAD